MCRDELHNLPLLFEHLGRFLEKVRVAQEKWEELPKDWREQCQKKAPDLHELFARKSQSPADKAINDYNAIVNTIYDAAAGGCRSGSTKMGK